MTTGLSVFDKRKERFVARFRGDLSSSRVDFDIADFLDRFNSEAKDYYTTSSCSGRIIVAKVGQLAFSKSKRGFEILRKWHRPITVDELTRSIEGDNVWVMARGAIVHFVARDFSRAKALLGLARRAGFKRSGVLNIAKFGVVVEVQGDDRVDIPLKVGGVELVPEERLGLVADVVNDVLISAKLRLSMLLRLLEKSLLHGVEDGEFDEWRERISREPYSAWKKRVSTSLNGLNSRGHPNRPLPPP